MLDQAIENKRKKMMKTANKYGFNSSKTVHYSQELDKLINLKQKTKQTIQLEEDKAIK